MCLLNINTYNQNPGQIWTRTPTDFDWWEVELVFRVTGRGRIGADGLVCSLNCVYTVKSLRCWLSFH